MPGPKAYIKTKLLFEVVQLLKVKEPEAGFLRVKFAKLDSNTLEVIAKHLREL